MTGGRAKGRGGLQKGFKVFGLLATGFSQHIGLYELQSALRCVCLLVTVRRAAFIYLFGIQNFCVVF